MHDASHLGHPVIEDEVGPSVITACLFGIQEIESRAAFRLVGDVACGSAVVVGKPGLDDRGGSKVPKGPRPEEARSP